MKKKIAGILVVTLLVATAVLPVSGRVLFFNNEKSGIEQDYKILASDNTKLKWMIAGDGLRSYWIHIPPSYDGSESAPLVIALHGASGFNIMRPLSSFIWWFSSSFMEGYTN